MKHVRETVTKVDLSSRPFKIWAEGKEDKAPVLAETLIISTGATAKRMSLPGEDIYWQNGISACAVCDGGHTRPRAQVQRRRPVLTGIACGAGARRMTVYAARPHDPHPGAVPIFRKKPLAVVGGGDSAVEEATYLTKYASKVYLLVRRDKLRASSVMQKRIMSNPKVGRRRCARAWSLQRWAGGAPFG